MTFFTAKNVELLGLHPEMSNGRHDDAATAAASCAKYEMLLFIHYLYIIFTLFIYYLDIIMLRNMIYVVYSTFSVYL